MAIAPNTPRFSVWGPAQNAELDGPIPVWEAEPPLSCIGALSAQLLVFVPSARPLARRDGYTAIPPLTPGVGSQRD